MQGDHDAARSYRELALVRDPSFTVGKWTSLYPEPSGADTAHYLELADRLGLKVSGGSDFHGDDSHGPGGPGSVALPRQRFDQLKAIGVR